MSDSAGRARDEGRDARLSFRKYAEYKIRNEFKADAMKKCAPQMHDFASCAEEKGLLVIFQCRKLNQAVVDCMKVHNSDEAFAKFLEGKPGLLEERTIKVGGGGHIN